MASYKLPLFFDEAADSLDVFLEPALVLGFDDAFETLDALDA